MNRTSRLVTLLVAAGFSLCHTARAGDLGDPVYRSDVSGKVRFEILYEKYEREAEESFGDLTYKFPTETIVVPGSEQTFEFDEDFYIGRLSYLAGDRAAVYVEGGAVDDSVADETGYVIGGGARWKAFEKKHIRINVVASGRQVSSLEAGGSGVSDNLGPYTYSTELEYFEASGGFVISGDAVLDPKTRLEPYGGLLYSVIRGDLKDGRTDYPESEAVRTYSADIEEDEPIVAVAGVTLIFEKRFSIRFEGRLIGDTSYSTALGAAF